MKTYTIIAQAVTAVEMKIKASSKLQAQKIARKADHKDWAPVISKDCPTGYYFEINGRWLFDGDLDKDEYDHSEDYDCPENDEEYESLFQPETDEKVWADYMEKEVFPKPFKIMTKKMINTYITKEGV